MPDRFDVLNQGLILELNDSTKQKQTIVPVFIHSLCLAKKSSQNYYGCRGLIEYIRATMLSKIF